MRQAVVRSSRVLLRSASGAYTAQPAAILVGRDGRISSVVQLQNKGSPTTSAAAAADFETLVAEWQRQGADVLDLGAALVTPAMVNCHTHTPMHALRGLGGAAATKGNVVEDLFFKAERSFEPGDVRAFARIGAFENLLAGVGTVWEHYYKGMELAQGLRDTGITAVVATTLQDLAGPGKDSWEQEWAVLEKLRAPEFAEQGIVAALGPHATDTVSDALWKRVAAEASTHDLPVHCHLAQSVEEYTRSMAHHGCSPVERLHRLGVLGAGSSFVGAHGLFLTHSDLRLLAGAPGKRAHLVWCPLAQMRFAFPAHVGSWLDAGVPVLLATDAAASNDGMNLQLELRQLSGAFSTGATLSAAHARFRESGAVEDAEQVQQQRNSDYQECFEARSFARILDTVMER
jgi:cytosine/adenosine deaminase-related metal-dependent hydrolase